MSPRPVFAAAYLLGGAAALWTTWAVGTLLGRSQFEVIFLNRTHGEGQVSSITSAYTTVSLVAIGTGLVVVLFAVLTALGSRTAGAIVWILCVPALAVALLALIAGGYDPAPWWGTLTRATGGATFVLVAGALVLLRLPASRAYWRDRGAS
jgi:hypothetical protein